MGERTRYTPGTFSWTDLTTADQGAAKAFYQELFGWEGVDSPVGDGVYYSMMRLDGRDVAAISPQPQQQRDAATPPMWNSYITVESADQAVERAKQLGATVHAPAFDVLDVGRMGVIQDLQGAFFLVWEPRSHIGASLVNAPGTMCWNELATTDLDVSVAFYSELFGWEIEPVESPAMPYMMIKNSEGWNNGGIRPVMPPGTPPHWLVYFGIDDVDAGLAKVALLGGSQLIEPLHIGPGKIGVVRDPQGAVFALYAGQFEP